MKTFDYEPILNELRAKYPGHTIDILPESREFWWTEPRSSLWVDGKKTETVWPECLAEDLRMSGVDSQHEITFMLNEEVKKVLDIL